MYKYIFFIALNLYNVYYNVYTLIYSIKYFNFSLRVVVKLSLKSYNTIKKLIRKTRENETFFIIEFLLKWKVMVSAKRISNKIITEGIHLWIFFWSLSTPSY